MTIIHVNRGLIDSNRKNKTSSPVLTVKTGDTNIYCNRVDILDDNNNVVASVVYSPDKPLSCGAKVWIETNSNIKTDVTLTPAEAKIANGKSKLVT
jgi:hypothetical protein